MWRDRESLGDLVDRAVERLRERPYRCADIAGDSAAHRLRFTGPSSCNVAVRLLAEPRPTALPPRRVHFRSLHVTVDMPRTVLAAVLERLLDENDAELLFDLEVCLLAGADLADGIADLGVRRPGADAWDLTLALRNLSSTIADGSAAGADRLNLEWRGQVQVFISRLMRRLLDFT